MDDFKMLKKHIFLGETFSLEYKYLFKHFQLITLRAIQFEYFIQFLYNKSLLYNYFQEND